MNHLAAIKIGDTFFGGSNKLNSTNITVVGQVVSFFLKVSFVIAGLILLFYFIFGGVGLISSAGKDNPKAQEQAKATMTSAVAGLIIVLMSYWIVKLIGTLIGQPNIL